MKCREEDKDSGKIGRGDFEREIREGCLEIERILE